MKRVILTLDESTLNVSDNTGAFVGTLASESCVDEALRGGMLTLQLVKQGVTVDEIIKLKNAELI